MASDCFKSVVSVWNGNVEELEGRILVYIPHRVSAGKQHFLWVFSKDIFTEQIVSIIFVNFQLVWLV